jgi:hypothetical protein
LNAVPVDANVCMLARHVSIQGYARLGHGIIAADSNLVVECPSLSIEWTTQDFKQVHGGVPFAGASVRLLVAGTPGVKERLTKPAVRTITHRVTMNDRIDELLELIEVEPDALREAEFLQAQAILETLVGKTVTSAEIEDTRIVITTSEGNQYFFYGFLGESTTP